MLLYSFKKIFLKVLSGSSIIFIYLGLIAGIIACLLAKGYSEDGRAILSFNDPNQLGYFAAILLASIVILIQYKNITKSNTMLLTIFDGSIIFISHYFLLLSISRSAMAAFIFIDLYFLLSIRNIKILLSLFLCFLLSAVFLLFFRPQFISERIESRHGHFTKVNMASSLQDRLIDPLKSFGGFAIIFGGGDFVSKKKTSPLFARESTGAEVHNIFGDLLKIYGLIGLALFLFWLIRFMCSIKIMKSGLWALTGLLIYNMGNNGIRFRALWIWIALLIAMEAFMRVKNKAE
jgi:hypothetical protein